MEGDGTDNAPPPMEGEPAAAEAEPAAADAEPAAAEASADFEAPSNEASQEASGTGASGTEAAPEASPPEATQDQERPATEPKAEPAADDNAARGQSAPSQRRPGQVVRSQSTPSSPHQSLDYKALKQKTEFSASSSHGVMVRKGDGPHTFMSSVSNFKTGAKYSFGVRGEISFMKKNTGGPPPGAYNLPAEKPNTKSQPKFSFGGESRFGLAQNPAKTSPGPGAYDAKDPLWVQPKVGFGSGPRSKDSLAAQERPGPGAYEFRTSLGQGRAFTAGRRHKTSYERTRSQPGPGAYNPNHSVFESSRKFGFGTGTRTSMKNGDNPGPGTYEMQNVKGTGSDCPKYSCTSRRRVQDLSSYITPAPGSYNSHISSFGDFRKDD
mmetsp:Transcript_69256/g.149420  ORF Transcript_69256/g.149420 Transcript_69256/m.149420 type:complete len:380 (-) Transcript_69256:191-1330(-)